MPIEVLDTTLRDGAQMEGIALSLDDKLKIATQIASLHIPFIEGGNPFSNKKDTAFFRAAMPTLQSSLVAFGSTHKPYQSANTDLGHKALLESGAKTISLFGKASLAHAMHILKCDGKENLRIIQDSIAFLKQNGRRVFFDAEHFFDGYQADADYAIQCLDAAASAGADALVLCDTNGGTLPDVIKTAVKVVCGRFDIPIGIHCHNDSGLAVANTLAAVLSGATHIQGTFLGLGERCGNANLCTLLPLLQLKCGYELIPPKAMQRLTTVSRTIAEIVNIAPNAHDPFIGTAAFTHKGGMHIDGMLKDTESFEHLNPQTVGNSRRFIISEQAGKAGVWEKLQHILPDISKESTELQKIIKRLKDKEFRGYAYENADASFELMALDTLGLRKHFFDVVDFNVISRRPQSSPDKEKSADAFVKVRVDDTLEISAAEGDGPVNALDKALKKALSVFYPQLNQLRLRDFKVRVLDSGGTASTVRVFIESTDGTHLWSTVGVSTNIIQACFKALVDSIDYMLTFY